MKEIQIIQNTDDWYKMRNDHLGASEANIIMGMSKFMTPKQLFDLKTGITKPVKDGNTYIQDKGHKMEAKMRNIMEILYDTSFDAIVVVSDDHPFLMASLDGYSKDTGAVWECKYVGQEDFKKVCDRKVLEHYYPQIQQQIMLTGAPFSILTAVTDLKDGPNPDFPYQYTYMEIMPDFEFMKEKLLPAMIDFWDRVQNNNSPDIASKDVVDLSDNEKLTGILSEYFQIKEQLDQLTKSKDLLEKDIYKIAKHDRNICNGVKITKTKSDDKEVFDYEKYCVENKVDLSGFTKISKGRITKRITFPKA